MFPFNRYNPWDLSLNLRKSSPVYNLLAFEGGPYIVRGNNNFSPVIELFRAAITPKIKM